MDALTRQLTELRNIGDGSELTRNSIALTEAGLRKAQETLVRNTSMSRVRLYLSDSSYGLVFREARFLLYEGALLDSLSLTPANFAWCSTTPWMQRSLLAA